ncbi:MAG: AraC family transcriptional regulator, partial [Akkermansiaceae bacterium]|nr:AraC family transcriptional regulator [Akkermansiaceae bacterium]
MSPRANIFLAGDERYHADTCAPLIAAHRAGEVELKAVARGCYPGRRLPAGVLPQVCSLGYWDAAHDQAWGLSEHRNEGVEITYLANGRLGFRADGNPYPLGPGNLTITRPWQPHSVGDPAVASSRLYWLILDVGVRQPHQAWHWPEWLVLTKSDLRNLTNLLRENEHPVWHGTPEIERCFADLGELVAAAQTGPPPATRLALAVNELLVCVHELLQAQDPPRKTSLTLGERTVAMFLDRLRAQLAEPWTLEMMAERAGLGRTRLAHYCRKLTNLAPMAYLQHLRIEEAKRRLAATNASITDIALDCGFGSSAYFASVFRAAVQCTPRQFRARHAPQPGGVKAKSGRLP